MAKKIVEASWLRDVQEPVGQPGLSRPRNFRFADFAALQNPTPR
jgi:hypothetical protein